MIARALAELHAEQGAPTDAIVAEIADEICCDKRSVVRRLAGLPVRGRVALRIDDALRARGLMVA